VKFISLPQLALLLYYQLSQIVNNFFYFFSKKFRNIFFHYFTGKRGNFYRQGHCRKNRNFHFRSLFAKRGKQLGKPGSFQKKNSCYTEHVNKKSKQNIPDTCQEKKEDAFSSREEQRIRMASAKERGTKKI
jgi:hypothetical protein